MLDCSLRSRGSRLVAAAFLAHSQTKSVSPRSFVQHSGARSWRVESAYFVGAREGKAPPLPPPQHGGTRFPDTRSQGSASRGCQAKLLAEEPSSALDEQVGE